MDTLYVTALCIWLVAPPLILVVGYLIIAARLRASEKRILTTAVVVLSSLFGVLAIASFLLFGGSRVSGVTVANDTSRQVVVSSRSQAVERVDSGDMLKLIKVGCVNSAVISAGDPPVEVAISTRRCDLDGRVITIKGSDGEDE